MGRKPRTLEELERELDAVVDAELGRPVPRDARWADELLGRPVPRDARWADELERLDPIFTRAEAKAVRDCLRGLPVAKQLIAMYWRQILAAAHAYKEHSEEDPMPMKSEIRRARRRGQNVAVRIMGGGQPGAPRAGRYAYIAALCEVYTKATDRSRWQGRRGPLELLRACLAPRLFFEKGRPLRDDAITTAVKRLRKPAPRVLLTQHRFDDPEEHRIWMAKCKQARLTRKPRITGR